MNDLKGYAKYQYSVFLGTNREEQFVLRTDVWEEFTTEVKKIKEHLEKKNGHGSEVKDVVADSERKWCSKHEIFMKRRVSKKTNKPYFAHYRPLEKQGDEVTKWDICFGSGWESDTVKKEEPPLQIDSSQDVSPDNIPF